MKNSALPIQQHVFSSADELIFDCNIWMYIFGPGGNPSDWKARVYSAALKNAKLAGSTIYIDALILSEFVNTYSRLVFHQQSITNGQADFKSYRNSTDFKPVASAIAQSVRRIIGLCQRTDSDFVSTDIGSVIDQYENANSDFNDLIIAELCKTRSLFLVTHDSDFAQQGIKLLTANRRLLT